MASAAAFCVSLVKQRLNGGLPLSAEELENVFNTLDSDGNGYLTLDEFSSGFSMFFSPPLFMYSSLSVCSDDARIDRAPELAIVAFLALLLLPR